MPTTIIPQDRILRYQEDTNVADGSTLHVYVLDGRFEPEKANSRKLNDFLTEAVSREPKPLNAMRRLLNMCAVLVKCFRTLHKEHHGQVFPFINIPNMDGSIDEANAVFVGQALDLSLKCIDWCAVEVVRHDDAKVNRPNPERQAMTLIVSTAPLAGPFSPQEPA